MDMEREGEEVKGGRERERERKRQTCTQRKK